MEISKKTQLAHKLALVSIEMLMEDDPKLGTPEGDLLSELAAAVGKFEKKVFPL